VLHKLCRIDRPFELGNVQCAMRETQRVPTVTAVRETWAEISPDAIDEYHTARYS
jgi:hypothetical protein